MTGKAFVDTNVFVYTRDATEPAKQAKAQAWISKLWQTRQGCLSFQVMHEYYVTVTRKLSPGLSSNDARADIRALLVWKPVEVNPQLLETAWRIEDRFRVSWWDSLIIAAAQTAAAGFLISEDLQEGMNFEGVLVVNPFRSSYQDLQ